MTSLVITLFMIIHKSSSKNGRKRAASKLLTHHRFCNFDFQIDFLGQISIQS